MKLEHCKIEPSKGGSWVNMGFSTPSKLTPELVTEIGRRIEHFLMPLHTPASEPTTYGEQTDAAIKSALAKGPVDNPPHSGRSSQTLTEPVVTPTRRTRTPKAEAPEPTEPVVETTPVRRTRAPAPVVAPEITDMDLAKAASGAAEVLGTQIVKDIIAEMGVKTVNEIEGFEKRQYFLDLLDAEKKLIEEEKANG